MAVKLTTSKGTTDVLITAKSRSLQTLLGTLLFFFLHVRRPARNPCSTRSFAASEGGAASNGGWHVANVYFALTAERLPPDEVSLWRNHVIAACQAAYVDAFGSAVAAARFSLSSLVFPGSASSSMLAVPGSAGGDEQSPASRAFCPTPLSVHSAVADNDSCSRLLRRVALRCCSTQDACCLLITVQPKGKQKSSSFL